MCSHIHRPITHISKWVSDVAGQLAIKQIEKKEPTLSHHPRSHDQWTWTWAHTPPAAALLPINSWLPCVQRVGLLILSCSAAAIHIYCYKKNPTHTYMRRGRFGGVQQEGEIHGFLLILLLLWLVLFPMLAQSLLLVWSYWHEPSSFSPYDDSWFGHSDTDHEFFSMLPNFCSWLGHIDMSQVAFFAWDDGSWFGHIDTDLELFFK